MAKIFVLTITDDNQCQSVQVFRFPSQAIDKARQYYKNECEECGAGGFEEIGTFSYFGQVGNWSVVVSPVDEDTDGIEDVMFEVSKRKLSSMGFDTDGIDQTAVEQIADDTNSNDTLYEVFEEILRNAAESYGLSYKED